ncbi:hypothetical protein BLNAU_16262 [Blattamonas nauphoetae]|uniref:SPRY domain-containing protein n=1 Tax=Blattamonas nauphoetae TaxID=2049346 RepID=A0ABQ9XC00_9EUKA|nr:hypothetical protein BLNAU_16262 [Blattamonas nauphoetae]
MTSDRYRVEPLFTQRDTHSSHWGTCTLVSPFSSGVQSVTITILTLPRWTGYLGIGLIDSACRVCADGDRLGVETKNSVSLNSRGRLCSNTPTSSSSSQICHSILNDGDCVRIICDFESSPRTVQFFVNGKTGRSYMSGIPSSVKIGFSAPESGTSFRIDNISRLSHSIPISPHMTEILW